MRLVVPSYGRAFEVEIRLADGQAAISDKTVATVNDVASLNQVARERIRTLLYEDAMRAREDSYFVEPNPPGKKYEFIPLAHDDPRHPCYFEHGVMDVEQKVEWVGIRINENKDVENRFALIDCYPAWEEEHGRAIVLRNGGPVGISHYDVDLTEFDDQV
jgi:hypothetical protein